MGKSIVADGEITGTILELRTHVIPETGEIFSIRHSLKNGKQFIPSGFIKPGKSHDGGGYRILCVPVDHRKYKKCRAHHAVWAWVTGCCPTGEIDHVNGNRDDNRIENLREVTINQNRTNKKIQSNNRSGYKWVYQDIRTGRWVADMRRDGKRIYRSFHEDARSAYDAACRAAQQFHGAFYNPG